MKGDERMTIIQVNFDVPDEIYMKILTGEYIRTGGVLRHNTGRHKGQFVDFLEEVNLNEDKIWSMGARVLNFP